MKLILMVLSCDDVYYLIIAPDTWNVYFHTPLWILKVNVSRPLQNVKAYPLLNSTCALKSLNNYDLVLHQHLSFENNIIIDLSQACKNSNLCEPSHLLVAVSSL